MPKTTKTVINSTVRVRCRRRGTCNEQDVPVLEDRNFKLRLSDKQLLELIQNLKIYTTNTTTL
jgi:hypothetical protein